MKNTLKHAKSQRMAGGWVTAQSTKPGATSLVSCLVLFIGVVLLPLGCSEPVQSSSATESSLADVSVNTLVPEAIRIVREGLADKDPQIRVNAIEVVAATKQVPMMPKVQRLLRDPLVPVRFLALLAVGDLQYALAQEEAKQLLNDPDENVRIAAAYALVRLGHPEYMQFFRNAIASEDQTVRANAALLLGKSGDHSTLTGKALWWTLQRKDSNDGVRFQAAEALAMLGDERIYPKLWAMLISAYADDRVVGIRAMGALRTERAKNALITMLDDGILEVRLAAAEQLGKFKDPIGEPEVLDVFTKNLTADMDRLDQQRVRVLTTLAIGQIGSKPLVKYLPRLLKDESRFVQLAAAKAVFQCAMRK